MTQKKKQEIRAEEKEHFDQELQRLLALDERERRVLGARKYIEEEILQLKCPRPGCRRAFYDFEGCFALSCSACPCKFCAWCLKDCGDQDAHPHVRHCEKVPRGVDSLFPHMPDVRGAFEKTNKQRCSKYIKDYLETLSNDIREDVRKMAQVHL